MKITVAGLGPGDKSYILPLVQNALAKADVVIGYDYYFQFAKDFIKKEAELIAMPLGKEEDRAAEAIRKAKEDKYVVVIGSGDASIYSMAAIVYEMVAKSGAVNLELETLPGISAFLAAGSKLGAPLGHDFCCISLSDLMTPWNVIEKRIKAAAFGDFVTSLYNPKSKKRHWQLGRLKKLFLEERAETTPVAILKQITRPEEHIIITTLSEFDPEDVDMFSLVMIGNSQTFQFKNYLVTPRGYLNRKPHTGKEIQQESFRIVTNHIKELTFDKADKWAITRVIHTTGVLDDHQYYKASREAISKMSTHLKNGGEIITDVTMVQSGITRAFIEKYGTKVQCCLNDEDARALAVKENITRSQAGIRKAISLYPNALYVIGNAPTALMEITEQLRNNKNFKPAGVIGTPVGFVNVIESKEQLSQVTNTNWVIIEGNRGGSNVAAAIVNAAFTLEESSGYFVNE
ncbi:precorrin-3B C(17)-methyltransferase [uncultured Aquimarina sp.]|uniref:precorrin-3B C(17)-methyltransferase n=1 Tax=uncultured Aquimarina sp. TaxID=575652 RepID=UPI00260EF117|nr:precorrin-3B C(17)-methyltransferase [uncultured Aquimarina sp.]